MLSVMGRLGGQMLAVSVGGLVVGAAVSWMESSKGLKPAESKGTALRPMDEKGQFFLMLANIVFRIDGAVSADEQDYLDVHSANAPEQLGQRIAAILASKDAFLAIRNWYGALSEATKKDVAAEAQRLINIDMERAEEEEAFLVQLAQIIEGHDRVELFVSCKGDKHKELLIDHGLFRYLSRQDFSQWHSHSNCEFHPGAIYTRHPYLMESLIPFAIDEFENAQDQLFNGIIELLKELDAKSVIISEYTEEKQADKLAGSGSVEGQNVVAKVKVDAAGSSSHEQLLHSTQDAKIEFEGSKRSFMDRLKVSNLEQELLRKYRNNPQCKTIIKTRFGHNKASSFEYKFKSIEARNIAKGMNAAAKLDHKLVKGSVSAKSDVHGSYTRTIEKNLVIHFH